MRNKLAASLLAMAAAGCSGMSKEECLYADWRAIGYEDGAAGRPVSAVSSRRATCAKKAGVTVDMVSYQAGRGDGLRTYCQPSRAFSEGSRGAYYHGVCTGPEEFEFTAAYQAGHQLYALRQTVAGISSDIQRAHNDLDRVAHDIDHTQGALISPGVPVPERVQLLADLKNLSEEKGNIETALIALNRDHVRAQEDLRAYEAELAYNGPYQGYVTSPAQARY